MNGSTSRSDAEDRRGILSTLWIFLTANYIFCDLLSLMAPGVVEQLIHGQMGGIQMSEVFLLQAAFLMEIPFAMILLARVLPYRANRWANLVAAVFMAVVQVGSLFVGSAATLHYIFFSVIEIAGTLLLAWYAWNWQRGSAVARAIALGS